MMNGKMETCLRDLGFDKLRRKQQQRSQITETEAGRAVRGLRKLEPGRPFAAYGRESKTCIRISDFLLPAIWSTPDPIVVFPE